jgi:hypothetical protein
VSPSRWCAPKELAAELGVSLRTVRRLIAARDARLEVERVTARLVRVRWRYLAPPGTTGHRDVAPET